MAKTTTKASTKNSKPTKTSSKTASKNGKDVKSKLVAPKKSKGEEKALSPLEKARIAKANGTAGKGKKKSTKKPIPIFKAPEDFKPHFLEVLVKTEKDGLLSSLIKATRYVGRYDPQAPDKKKIDLGSYDPVTLQGILSRLSMTTYATNVAKRLPGGTTYKILLRVNRKSKDGSISVGFKMVSVGQKSKKTGRVKAVELDKKDPQYRMFRKCNRIIPAAFKDVLMPPKRVRGVKVKNQEEDE